MTAAAAALLTFAAIVSRLPEQLLAGASTLLGTLARTSLQGGLVVLLIWLLCRLAPRMPAGVRAGLWWLAGLHLLVGLAWPRPIALPLLPAGAAFVSSTTDERSTARPRPEPQTQTPPHALTRVGPQTSADPALSADPDRHSAVTTRNTRDAEAAISGSIVASSPTASSLTGIAASLARMAALPLVALWLGIASVRLMRLARLRRRLRALVARADAPPAEVQAALDRLCASVAPWQTPGLGVSDDVETPQVCGARRPVILLPRGMLTRLSPEQLSMTLYHELTHVTRGDLWLGWIPAIARELFFFHPLAAMAAREYGVAREAACDAAVIHRLDAEPQDYGRLLVTLGVTSPRAPRHAPLAAAGSSSSVRLLKRRLVMLQQLPIRPSQGRAWWTLTALAIVSLVPIQLVGQRERATEPQSSTATTVASGGPVGSGVAGGVNGGVAGGVAGGVTGGVAGGVVSLNSGGKSLVAIAGSSNGAGIGSGSGAGSGSGSGIASGSGSGSSNGAGFGAGDGSGIGSGLGAGTGSGIGSGTASANGSGIGSGAGAGVGSGTATQVAVAGTGAHDREGDVISGRPVTGEDDDRKSGQWVFLSSGRNVSMNGSSRDVARARAHQKGDEPLLWFRRDGQEYIVRDPALHARLIELFRPQEELGRQQGELGERQGELGRQQGELGSRQGELGEQQGKIGSQRGLIAAERAVAEAQRAVAESSRAEQATTEQRRREAERLTEERRREVERLTVEAEKKSRDLSREQDALGSRQEELGRQQEALGRKQEELGRQQEALGRKQEEASRRADVEIKALMRQAIDSGAAQKVP